MNKDCFRHAMYFGLLLGVLFFIHFAVSLLHNTSLSVMLQLVMKIVIPVVAVLMPTYSVTRRHFVISLYCFWQRRWCVVH